MTRIWWHYTIGAVWPRILQSGALLPSVTTGLVHPGGERCAVWFSAETWWEPTAVKAVVRRTKREDRRKRLHPEPGENLAEAVTKTLNAAATLPRLPTMQELHEQARGLIRIGVTGDVAPFNWRTFKATGGALPEDTWIVEQGAKRLGANTALWRCSFDPVPVSAWAAVERFTGRRWEPLPRGEQQHADPPGRG